VFSRVNNGRGAPYETVGDMYYAFGVELAVQESKERGVAEWKIARRTQGPQRKRCSLKLSRHYISEGADALLKGLSLGATDADLKNALRNFERALEYDGKSELAADKISESQKLITQRAKDYDLQSNVLNTSREVSQEAEKSRADGGFVTAIDRYQQAAGLLDAINERFPDLASSAISERKGIQNNIRDIIDDVLDRADILLEEGDTALAASSFDVAIAAYGKVPGLLEGIPVDPGSPDETSIRSAIDRAAEKIVETELARKRAEELKQQQGLPGGGPGGRPGNP
jgi:tetratricopeptide (TPR) repeat protein